MCHDVLPPNHLPDYSLRLRYTHHLHISLRPISVAVHHHPTQPQLSFFVITGEEWVRTTITTKYILALQLRGETGEMKTKLTGIFMAALAGAGARTSVAPTL